MKKSSCICFILELAKCIPTVLSEVPLLSMSILLEYKLSIRNFKSPVSISVEQSTNRVRFLYSSSIASKISSLLPYSVKVYASSTRYLASCKVCTIFVYLKKVTLGSVLPYSKYTG